MREDKKYQRPHRPASIDGIVSDGRRLGMPVHRSYQPNRPTPPELGTKIDRPDGFHPMRQSASGSLNQLPDEESLLDEPIVLDDDVQHSSRKQHKLGPKRSKHPKLRKFIKRTLLLLVIIFAVGGTYFGYKIYHTQKKVLTGGGKAPAVCDGNVPVSQLQKEGDGRVNILLAGIGGEGHEGAYLTDTLMLASLDPETDKMDLISIPRDFWVKIPGYGTHKINEAYYDGRQSSKSKDPIEVERSGTALMDQTVGSILDVPIHYNAVFDFKAFQDMVNALGGVDINVTKDEAVYEVLWVEGTSQHYTLNVQPGLQHFDGTRALYFARSRHTSARGDFDRAERQRSIISAIKDKALSIGTFSNPIKISSLLDSFGNNVYTDFDTGSLKCLYQQVSQVPSSSIASLDMVTPPHDLLTTAGVNGISTVQPKAGLYNYTAIQDYVHSVLRDGFLAKENAPVAIYNATGTAGLATTQANILKSFGYNVNTVSSLTGTTYPEKTVLVDLSKGTDKYTRNYLEKRYRVTALTSLPAGLGVTPPQGTQFVIILGNDASSTSSN